MEINTDVSVIIPKNSTGLGSWYLQTNAGKIIFSLALSEMNFCCGIHVIGNFSTVKLTFEQFKLLIDTMKPYFRLALITNNDTIYGTWVNKYLEKLGAQEITEVISNHAADGNGYIHLWMLRGTKSDPVIPEDIEKEQTPFDDYYRVTTTSAYCT